MSVEDNNWKVPKEDPQKISVEKPAKSAGGYGALSSSIKETISRMGTFRSMGLLTKLNQKNGIDCPGCAWPEPENRSVAEFCENGAKAIAEEATKKLITEDFFKKYSVNDLAKKSDYWLGQQGRLTAPMFLNHGKSHYQKISWEKALKLLADNITKSGPQENVFYTSGRASNEAAFAYQLMVRLTGTNNLPDCSNLCHESSGVAMKETVGIGKGTVTLEDFDHAEVILIYGQNPGTNHPRMLTTLEQAAQKGCEIITINPLEELGTKHFIHPKNLHKYMGSGTKMASDHVPIKIGGDIAFSKGLIKFLIEENDIDNKFISEQTAGFEELKTDSENESWDEIEKHCGISKEKISSIGKKLIGKKRIICCWAMGVTQHKFAVGNIQSITNLLLLKGSIGIKGAGPCPVRGHSNVQGNRTVGIWEHPSEAFLKNLETGLEVSLPRAPGHNVVQAIEAMSAGKVKTFLALGGNLLSASPDTEFTAKSFKKVQLTAQISTKLNRSHLVTGKQALILPCLGRTDRDQMMSVENSMGVVHSTTGTLTPCSEHLKSEVAIVCELANELFPRSTIPWIKWQKDYALIRDAIGKCIPGFENYNQRLKNGFNLPNPPRDSQTFETENKKANFIIHSIPDNLPEKGKLMMMTIRTHDQFNTTIYGPSDRYRGINWGRRVILLNKEDMERRKFKEGTLVDIKSYFKNEVREVKRFFVVPYEIPSGCAATYFPETNPLVPIGSFAEKSMTPTSKSVLIDLAEHAEP